MGTTPENQGDVPEAIKFYRAAIGFNSSHSQANKRLNALLTVEVSQETNTPAASLSSSAFYNLIQNDQSALSKQVIVAINALNRTSRARVSAFMPYVWINFFFTFVFAVSGIPALPVLPIAIILFCLSFLSLVFAIPCVVWRAKTTRYVFAEGRIQIEKGIVFRVRRNFELYRIEDMELHQSLWDRMTNNGKIKLKITPGHGGVPVVTLRGLAPLAELQTVFEQLRNVVVLLRTGPWGKGVIY